MTTPTQIQTIPAKRLCALTGLTDRRHRQIADEGYFPPPVAGEYQLNATIAGLFKYFQKDDARLSREKLRLAVAARKLAERRNEEAEEVQAKRWFPTDKMLEMFRAVVNRFEQLPGKVRSETGANEVYERILQKHIDDTRHQIASDIGELIPKAP
jgi:hypothetical protein